jgi:hypothetical protein
MPVINGGLVGAAGGLFKLDSASMQVAQCGRGQVVER